LAAAVTSDGSVVVQVVCAGPRLSVEQVALQVCATERWRDDFQVFPVPFVHVDPRTYPELAASAGLSISELNVTDLEWDFGSREAFSRWCTVGFADFTARLTPADVPAWVAEVVDGYEAVAGRPGLFRFLQLHAVLRLARAVLTS
jgi:trans-aconitate 2-methyltransferase